MEKQIVEIKVSIILKFIFIVGLLVFAFLIRDIIAILLLAMVIAYAFEPAIFWFKKRGIPRVLGALFIYFFGFFALLIIFYLIVPTFFLEVKNFISQLPALIEKVDFSRSVSSFKLGLDIDIDFSKNFQDFLGYINKLAASLGGGFFNVLISIFGGIFSFVLVIIFSVYISLQEGGIQNFIKTVSPKEYEEYVLKIWLRASRKIGFWLQGQILLGAIVGILVYLALSILQIKYALSLAVLAGIFEIIPVFGAIMAAVPAIAIGFSQSLFSGFFVFIAYFIIQQLENNLIYPVVVSKIIGVPSIIAILSLIIGGKLGGIMGLLLAVPVAVILMEIATEFSERKRIQGELKF